jgi:hypothetical protein
MRTLSLNPQAGRTVSRRERRQGSSGRLGGQGGCHGGPERIFVRQDGGDGGVVGRISCGLRFGFGGDLVELGAFEPGFRGRLRRGDCRFSAGHQEEKQYQGTEWFLHRGGLYTGEAGDRCRLKNDRSPDLLGELFPAWIFTCFAENRA